MTIYLDIVFLENFLLNFIIIYATALLSKNKIKRINFILSSCFGSLCSIVEYVIGLGKYLEFLFEVIISILMVMIAFNVKKKSKILLNLLYFYLVSIAFGGMSFMILFFNQEAIAYKESTYTMEIVSVGTIISFVLVLAIAIIIKIRDQKRSELIEIEIINKGKCHKVKALYDTGNLLKEPITNQDVIIVEKRELYNVCDKEFLDITKDIIEGKWIGDSLSKYRFCLIPFSSLGNDNGLLIGFKPDYIKVIQEEEYLKNEVFIGIYEGKLTNNNLYTSLIGLNILNKEECINEFI